MESDSSGYISFQTESTEYDNNTREVSSPRGKSYINESGIQNDNIYHRIHQYDSDGRFNFKQVRKNRPRPLPSVPRHQRRQHSTDIERRSRPRLRFTIILISLGVFFVVVAAMITLRVTCFRDLLCSKENEAGMDSPQRDETDEHVTWNKTSSISKDERDEHVTWNKTSSISKECLQIHPCVSQVLSNYSDIWQSSCLFYIDNVRAVIAQSEDIEHKTYILDDDTMNLTLDGMTIAIIQCNGEVTLDFEIQEVNCSNTGIRYVTLTNGTHNETHKVNVTINPDTQLCPCIRQTFIHKQANIQCRSTTRTNVSVTLRNGTTELELANLIPFMVLMENRMLLMEGLWLEASSDSGNFIRLDFRTVKCSHAGTYIITLGNTKFETMFSVTKHPCNNHVSWNYSDKWEWSCFVAINNTRTMILKTEDSESEIYMLDDDKMNVTRRGMVITITRSDGGVTTNFGIQEVNCSTTGSYTVTLNNTEHTETFVVDISVNPDTQLCPCTRQTVIQKPGNIQCRSTSSANVSVTFRDAILANQIPIDELLNDATFIMDGLQLSATHSNSEAVIRLNFPTVECSHAGSYFITLGNTMFETILSVASHPDKPIIDVYHDELGGLVEGWRGEIQCRAGVGCGQSSPSLYEKVIDEYQLVRTTTSSKTTSDSGSLYIVTLAFDNIHMQSTNGTEYMCSYMVDGVLYESDVFVALVIPGEYCGNLYGCDMRHPYDCSKYITCTTRPLERLCAPGLHFRPSGPCAGQCEHQNEANCHPGS